MIPKASKTSPTLWWPHPHQIYKNSSYHKIYLFSEPPQNIEIQNFEPPKILQAYLFKKISEYSPGSETIIITIIINIFIIAGQLDNNSLFICVPILHCENVL